MVMVDDDDGCGMMMKMMRLWDDDEEEDVQYIKCKNDEITWKYLILGFLGLMNSI